MTGVPGGDVTLHAAITETLAKHSAWAASNGGNTLQVACRCDHVFRALKENADHLADRVLAVLADRLPHTPPDQLATLIGGEVQMRLLGSGCVEERVITDWVPDSPPAAAQPPCTCYFTPRVLAPPCLRHPAAPEPLPAAPTEEPTP